MIKKNQPEPLITIIAERSCLRGQSGQSCDRTWEEESGRLAGASLSTGHQVPPVLDDGDGRFYLARWMLDWKRGKNPASVNFSMCLGMFSPLTLTLMSSLNWKMAENSKTYIISLTHVVQCSFVLYCTCTFSDCKSLYIH